MSRTPARLAVFAALLVGGAAHARDGAPVPVAPVQVAPAPAAPASAGGLKVAVKPGLKLHAVPELKAAHDEVAAAAQAVKAARGGGQESFRLAVMLLVAADKAREADDLATAKALAKEARGAAAAAVKTSAAVLSVEALQKKNPKLALLLGQADALVPPADVLGRDPDRWARLGLAPAHVD